MHITTGNGGPPSADNFCEDPNVPACRIAATRKQSTDFGYGRLIAKSAEELTFQQYLNKDGSMFDELTIQTKRHGPF